MLKTNNKTRLEVCNSVALQDYQELEKKGKGKHFTSRFIEPGIAEYKGTFGKVLITKETLDKFINTMVGVPVTIKHKDITDKNVKDERVGTVSEVWYNSEDGWYYCSGIIFDAQAIDLIQNQNWSVSCTYDFESDFKKGTYHGLDYDMQFTGGEFLHLALVPNPRYERATIVMNSQDDVDSEKVFLQGLKTIIENSLGSNISEEDKELVNGLCEIFSVNNDRWITIGADKEEGHKGRHILVKDGETNKEATERKVKEWEEKGKKEETTKSNSETQKLRDLIKAGFDKNLYYEKLEKETSKFWDNYTKAMRETTIYFDDSEEVKKEKKEKLNAIHEEYVKKRDERNKAVQELNQIIRETQAEQTSILNKLKDNIDIKTSLGKYDSSEVTKKIEKVISEYNIEKFDAQYKQINEKINASNEKWLKYINSASSVEEQDNRVKEHEEWYKKSDLKKEKDKIFDKIYYFSEYRQKAISEALQIPNGGKFNITTIKNSKLTDKVKKANDLLSGIVNKNYLPDFSPHANGKAGRANATGNIINITSKHEVTTYLHESMHWLERVNPNMLANSMAFLEYRTKGEAPKKLKKLTGKKYENYEEAKPDKFFDAYCGKIYDRATEIMSMGIERLFKEPDKFMKDDKEYFDFVIANLQGKI